MSRIGNKVVVFPAGVSVNLEGTLLTVKGPKGELKLNVNPDLTIEINGNELVVKRPSDSKEHRAIHGTTRALINNMVIGVSEGFEKVLEKHDLNAFSLNLSDIGTDDADAFLDKYKVDGTPTVMFFVEGKETSTLKRLVGNKSESQIESKLRSNGYIE